MSALSKISFVHFTLPFTSKFYVTFSNDIHKLLKHSTQYYVTIKLTYFLEKKISIFFYFLYTATRYKILQLHASILYGTVTISSANTILTDLRYSKSPPNML